jgi:hypothetical protein
MSLSAVAGLGWRFQRDLLGVSDFAGADAAAAPASAAAPIIAQSSNTADATAAAGTLSGARSQDVESFMQALYEALSNAASESEASASRASTASNEAALYSPPSGPTYSRGSVASYRANGYSQGQKGLSGKIQSLISALSDPEDSPQTQTSISGLQNAFSRLMSDLEASGATPSSSTTDSGSGLTLRSWLLGLQQNLQRPGASAFSSVGNMVDVTA